MVKPAVVERANEVRAKATRDRGVIREAQDQKGIKMVRRKRLPIRCPREIYSRQFGVLANRKAQT